jgi:succinate-acetate transporter protein
MFMNAMYGGLGQSLGALIGGKLQSMFGTVKMFYYAGTFDLIFVIFLVVYLVRNQDSSFRNPKPIEPKGLLTATSSISRPLTSSRSTR